MEAASRIAFLFHHDLDFHRFLVILPFLSLSIRKDIILCLRTRAIPGGENQRVNRSLSVRSWHQQLFLGPRGSGIRAVSGTEVVDLITRANGSPLIAGLLSMLVRQMPMEDTSDYVHALEEGKSKEIWAATNGVDRDVVIDYDVFMGSPLDIWNSLSVHLPPRPQLSRKIQMIFKRWRFVDYHCYEQKRTADQLSRDNMEDVILWPRYNARKNVAHESGFEYMTHVAPHSGKVWESHGRSTTTLDLERLYCNEGIRIGGRCEARSAFKFTDLKPRIYYAMGGKAFHDSKYIRQVFNTLIDSFPVVNRRLRYSVHRIEPLHDRDLVLYDYSSFTSNLSELKYFLDALGDFCLDTEVKVLDTHYGLIPISLGQLILDYNESCNQSIEFTTHRLFGNLGSVETNTAIKSGLLGVNGNIVSSTTLHGLHVAYIAGSMSKANCVGDDAEVATVIEESSLLEPAVSSLGDAAPEKHAWFRDVEKISDYSMGWHYLKRPFTRILNTIDFGEIIDFPGVDNIIPYRDGVHTVDIKDYPDRKISFVMQVSRFFDKATRVNINGLDRQLVLKYFGHCYRMFRLPMNGSLQHRVEFPGTSTFRMITVPANREESFDSPWLDTLLDQSDEVMVNMPVDVHTVDTRDAELGPDSPVGHEFLSIATKSTKLLSDLGFLESRLMKEDVYVGNQVGRDHFRRFLQGQLEYVYVYRVVRNLPLWWKRDCYLLV